MEHSRLWQEEEKTDDEILKLVQLVDQNKSIIPKWFDPFRGKMLILLIAFIYAFIVIYVSLIYLTLLNFAVAVAGIIALAGLTISFFTGIKPLLEENIVQVCYKRLETCHNVKNPQKPLLKALIKMRIKNPEFDLEQIYNMNKVNKDMFTKEKLLERLYE